MDNVGQSASIYMLCDNEKNMSINQKETYNFMF